MAGSQPAVAAPLRSAPVRRLSHPLEVNPVWTALGRAASGLVACAVGLPLLLLLTVLVPLCLLLRWLLLMLHWNRLRARDHSSAGATGAGGGPESVRGNDGRWLGAAWRRSVIHAVLIFGAPGAGAGDGGGSRSGGGEALDVARLRELLSARVLPLYPRLTRRPVPLGAGHCWLPDAAFSLDKHVFAGPAGVATEHQLQEYVGRLLGEGLPRDKPPWEVHVLSGYEAARDTVAVLRVHQSVADGMALLRVLCHSLADCHVLHVPQRPLFGGLSFPFSLARALLLGPLTLLLWLFLAADDCNLLTQRKAWTGRVTVTWSAAIALSKLTRIKAVTRSSLNCVLLSALAGAARRFLQNCGVRQPPDMKVVVPVDLRGESSRISPRLGSKMAPVVLALPVSLEGAVPRLWAARRRLERLRASCDAVIVYIATAALMAVAPGRAARKLLGALTECASLQFASLPGPPDALRVAGAALKGVYPLLPAQSALGIAVSVFTYADHVYVTVAADSALRPAAHALLAHLHDQVEQLWTLLLHRRVPGERRLMLRRADVTASPVRELRLRLSSVQDEVARLSQAAAEGAEEGPGAAATAGAAGAGEQRLLSLKSEFSELLSELRRRQSVVEGGSPLFEDEEVGGELWQPRRRAMSCTASRRSSRASLMLLLTSRRPASFVCPHGDDDNDDEYDYTSPPPPPGFDGAPCRPRRGPRRAASPPPCVVLDVGEEDGQLEGEDVPLSPRSREAARGITNVGMGACCCGARTGANSGVGSSPTSGSAPSPDLFHYSLLASEKGGSRSVPGTPGGSVADGSSSAPARGSADAGVLPRPRTRSQ